jgi:predicted DNA-binding protein YlxM (UPF0122 family)
MISAFKHIRLSGYNLLPQSVDGQTRLTLNSSGVAYFSELSTASGVLNTKIDAFSDTFQSFVNNLDNTYATDASVTTVANNLATTGSTLQTNINTVATNLATTGAANLGRINSLSGTLTSTYATISNLASTGANLQAQINNLDSVYATDASVTTVANNLATTGSTLQTNINTVATNLATTGAANLARINSLSGTLNSDYVKKATQQQFIVTLPLGVESTGISFPVAFASIPNSVQVTFEPSTDVTYMVAVKNRTTAGFTAEFSDVLFEAENKLNVFASV